MWLLSFAWRNGNLKQKQKGKREGRVRKMRQIEGKQTPSHTADHHPFFNTSYFNKNNHYLCMANTSSTTRPIAYESALARKQKQTNSFSYLRDFSWSLQHTHVAPIHLICTLHAAYSPLKLFTGLWSYDYPAPDKPSTPPLNCVLLTAGAAELQPEHRPNYSNQPPPQSHSDAAFECLITC